MVEDGKQVSANAAQNKEMAKTAALAMEQEAKQVVASAKEFMSKTPIGKERVSGKVIEQETHGIRDESQCGQSINREG